jgi:aconitate hydratase 2/2-methylisocitrate dehydratase
MNIYNDYLQEIEERKGQGLNPKPIDGAELLLQQMKRATKTHKDRQLLSR